MRKPMFDLHNEECWMITGEMDEFAWWGKLRNLSTGTPTSVMFNYYEIVQREDKYHDVIGFFHTHPGMIARPSEIDITTMFAWSACLGKPLICAILGSDGLKSYEFNDKEESVYNCETTRRLGFWVFGVRNMGTEIILKVTNVQKQDR